MKQAEQGAAQGTCFLFFNGAANQFNGSKTIFTNHSSDRGVYIAQSGTTTFNSNIEVNNIYSSAGIDFGEVSGVVTLASGKTITVGSEGYSTGFLKFHGFNQVGTTPLSLTLTGTGYVHFLKSVSTPANLSTFAAPVTISAQRVYLSGAVFNNTLNLTVSGSSYTCEGGNQFNGNLTLTNTGSGNITLANVTGDDYNGNVSFIKSSSGAIYPSYNGTSTYAGNITVTGSATFAFGSGSTGCMSVLDGSTTQSITTASGASVQFKKLKINKAAATVTLANDITVTDSLIFVDGITTTGANNVILSDNCKIAGVCDSSYVDGKVKKVGNDAFTYPVGKNGYYRKIGISAPANTTDAFTAEYFEQNSNDTYSHSSRDGSIAELSRNEYWHLARTTGSSTVNVTMSWDTTSTSCAFASAANLKVAAWDGSQWKDKGNGGTTGNLVAGTVVTSSASSVYGPYTLSSTATFCCNSRTDSSLVISAITLQDTVVHITWDEHPSKTTWVYTLEKSTDGTTFFPIASVKVDTAQDIMELEPYEVDPYNGILYSTEATPGFIFNDTVLNYAQLLDVSYRVRLDSSCNRTYTKAIKPQIYKIISEDLPPILLTAACPAPETPPIGYTATNITYSTSFGDGCCLKTYTLYTNTIPLATCVAGACFDLSGPHGSTKDCECSCTYDACCHHLCADRAQCNCPAWYSCSGNGLVWVLTSATPDWWSSVHIAPVPPVICEGESVTLSIEPDITSFLNEFSEITWTNTVSIISHDPSVIITTPGVGEYSYELVLGHINCGITILNYTLTVSPIYEIEITPSEEFICPGEGVTLTASGGSTYLWSTGATTSSINVTTAGTYTVTDLYGCSNEATITMPAMLQANATAEDFICGNTLGQLFGSATGGAGPYTYSWSPPTGLSSTTAANPTVDLEATEDDVIYTLTVTDDNECVSTVQVTVIYHPCCIVADHTASNGSDDLASDWGSSVTGDGIDGTPDFAINGTFTIDVNFTFNNAEVVLGTNAVILVDDGKTLTITSTTTPGPPDNTRSHLYACDDMWGGIYVSADAKIVVNEGSIIEDAQLAVYVEKPGTNAYVIEDAIFNKNLIHFMSFNSNNATPGTIATTSFLCENLGTGNPELLIEPHETERTHTGILTQVTNLNCGAGNLFRNARIGIYTQGFRDIAIFDGNTFEDLDFGIHGVMNRSLSVTDNIMSNITYFGVQGHQCANGDIDINDNSFSDNIGICAIWCHDNRSAEIETSGNTIDFTANTPNTGIGIGITEVLPEIPFYFKAQSNSITAAWCGIQAVNLTGQIDLDGNTGTVYVGDNSYISQNKSVNDAKAGILMQNCRGAVVTNNYVTSESGIPGWIETGIRMELGSLNAQTCNTTAHIGRGIFVSGNVFPNGLAQNTFNDNQTGLFLNYGVIGQQGIDGAPNDNKWLTGTAWDDTDYLATVVYDDDPDVTYVTSGLNSPFIVRTGTPPYDYNPPASSNIGSGQANPIEITFSTTSDTYSEPCQNFNPGFFEVGTPWIDEAYAIAHNLSLGSSEIDVNLKWIAKYGLYKYIADDALLMGETPLSNFYDSCFTGNIGIIDRCFYPLRSLTAAYDTSMGVQALPAPGIEDDYLDSLLALIPSCNTEQNLIDLLVILYTNVVNETEADNTDIEAIRDIAELCPYTDGFAVYMARTWLLQYDTLMNNYVNTCEYSPDPGSFKTDGNNRPNTQQQLIDESTLMFKLYPNPNNGQMTLEYDLAELPEAYLNFSNMYGQLVSNYRLKQGKNKIDVNLSELVAGIYIVQITSNDKSLYKEKVIIFK